MGARSKHRWVTWVVAAAIVLATAGLGVGVGRPAAPSQALTGPGGRDYPHQSVKPARFGEGDLEYWVFEPDDPAPDSAPVVVFMHGWAAMSPRIYGAWIEHLVRRGNIVIYPRYQATPLTPPDRFTENSVAALRSAFETLERDGHVRADTTKVAYVGHSAGGLLAVNLAIVAAESGLPVPRAVMSNQPGVARREAGRIGLPMADLTKFPAGALLVTTAGDRDTVTRDVDAAWVYRSATSVPADRRAMLRFVTDTRGEPWLIADHGAPTAMSRIDGGIEDADWIKGVDENAQRIGRQFFDRMAARSVNAMDTHGYWAVLDRLMTAGFTGVAIDDAMGRTEAGRSLGAWSDGTPIRPLERIE